MPKRKRKEPSVNLVNPLAVKVKKEKASKSSTVPVPEIHDEAEKIEEDFNYPMDPNIIKQEPNFNLYVGTTLGVLKGVVFGGELPISKNLYKAELRSHFPSVHCLSWADGEEKELLVTFADHVVKTFNTKLRCFTRQVHLNVEPEDERMVGLYSLNEESYSFGLQNGTLGLWNLIDSNVSLKIKTGSDMCKVQQCRSHPTFYATGGKENDLKIWDLSSENPETPWFKAKNVPHDELDLRQPVWVQDITFLPRTNEVVAVGTRHGQVRLYDVRAGLRPLSNYKFLEEPEPIMAISTTMNDRQVIVGTGRGSAGLIDLRNPGKEKLLLKYRGYSGGIRNIVASNELPYFASCGLDRHLYVHKLTERMPIKKLYLHQQLNCIAISKSFKMESAEQTSADVEGGIKKAVCQDVGDDWTNIPTDVLNVSFTSVPADSTPKKKVRRGDS